MSHFLYTPFNCQSAPDGSWVLLDIPDNHGQPIAQVREFKIDQLYLHELNEHLELTPDKKKYLIHYVQMLKEGQSAPLIDVIQTEDGRDKVVDGHRRTLAAAAIGQRTIRGLYSPLVNDPDLGFRGLTLELLQSGIYQDEYSAGKRFFEGYELQVLKSAAGFYVGTLSDDGFPHSRISVEYWNTRQQAEDAFKHHRYTTRDSNEIHSVDLKSLSEAAGSEVNGEDWLVDLLGTEEQNAEEKNQREQVERWMRSVVSDEIERVENSIQNWKCRVYKDNNKAIELVGDGPSRKEQMSIGAINESRRNRAIAGLTEELSYLKELEILVSQQYSVSKLKNKFGALKEDADKSFREARAMGRAKTHEEWFEQVLLSTLDVRANGYRGSVSSNAYSRLIAALLYHEKPTVQPDSPIAASSGPSVSCDI